MKEAKYIGGEFSSVDLDNYITQHPHESVSIFFPQRINDKNRILFETGTDALAHIIHAHLEKNKKCIIWTPFNYCFETLQRVAFKLQSSLGIIEFKKYEDGDDIQPSNENINFVILLHFNRYTDNTLLIESLNGKSVITIEDFVQASLDIKLLKADYAFNSLRKLCGLEVAVCYSQTHPRIATASVSSYYKIKKEAMKLKSLFFQTNDPLLEINYLDLFNKANESLYDKELRLANQNEESIFNLVDFHKLAEKRIENYSFMTKNLKNTNKIDLVDGEYMYLMIKSEKRNDLKKYLMNNNVFPAVHWADSNSTESLSLLSLHIDFRYNLNDLDKVIHLIDAF
jgi:hypothetical protein